eukprot:scaffold114033_cov20-Tisochrysis_lutea.AAC.5
MPAISRADLQTFNAMGKLKLDMEAPIAPYFELFKECGAFVTMCWWGFCYECMSSLMWRPLVVWPASHCDVQDTWLPCRQCL